MIFVAYRLPTTFYFNSFKTKYSANRVRRFILYRAENILSYKWSDVKVFWNVCVCVGGAYCICVGILHCIGIQYCIVFVYYIVFMWVYCICIVFVYYIVLWVCIVFVLHLCTYTVFV
jgi:hypothetical protein